MGRSEELNECLDCSDWHSNIFIIVEVSVICFHDTNGGFMGQGGVVLENELKRENGKTYSNGFESFF